MEIRTILNGAIAAAALAGTACSHKSETDTPAPDQSATAAGDTAVGQARQSRDSLSAVGNAAGDSLSAAGNAAGDSLGSARDAVSDSVAAAGDSIRP